jgi:ComF family protein
MVHKYYEKKGGSMPFWYDFVSLLFPRVCASCGNTLLKHEKCICHFCLTHLPRTDYHLHADNPAARLFWGRVDVGAVTSCFYFHKGSRVQHLVHGLKYKGKQETGTFLGRMYGHVLKSSELFKSVDVVVPVPLHARKKRRRGYNHSELFASGLAYALGVPMDCRSLQRITATGTQTKKSRFRRWENVKEVFALVDTGHFAGKHVLLVDDVVTTGATLEACAHELLRCNGAKVSMATIACAIR